MHDATASRLLFVLNQHLVLSLSSGFLLIILILVFRFRLSAKMSAHDNEELIDYEDDQDYAPTAAATTGTNGAAKGGAVAVAEGEDKDGKNFSGIHSTGFR